ncbi:hypothetical protein MMC10_011187 [Thelotrema lepadinum]|nr:hypothetical protein [Thelotrema lepadinum]
MNPTLLDLWAVLFPILLVIYRLPGWFPLDEPEPQPQPLPLPTTTSDLVELLYAALYPILFFAAVLIVSTMLLTLVDLFLRRDHPYDEIVGGEWSCNLRILGF